MGEWLDYSLADFLLFSPETYWRLFELMNEAVWPMPIIVPAVLTATAIAAGLAWRHSGWAIALSLAVGWAIVAHAFLGTYYAAINWAVAWIIPLAWVQAGLVLVLAPGLRFVAGERGAWLAYGALVIALAYPVLGFVAGRPLVQSEIAGLAPDPTALLTIGLVSLARPNWRVLVLSVLPFGWLLLSAVTLAVMDEPTRWVFVVGLLGAAWMFWRRRRLRRA